MIDDRKAAILKAVIEEFTATAQPVGSSAAARKARVKVSPATVRNDMAALETEGFLHQPHTSAGRIPTEKGYRFFVDNLIADSRASADAALSNGVDVSTFFGQMQGEIEEVMARTAHLLSDLTDYAAVVVDETDEAVNVRSIQVVALTDQMLMAVVVLANGQVNKYTFEFEQPVGDDDVAVATSRLRAAFEDRQIIDPQPLVGSNNESADAVALQFYRAIIATDEPDRVYVDGTSKVAAAFEAVESVSQVLTILEQQLVVVSLLANVVERGMSVAIGTETGVEPLAECSLVVSPYSVDGERAGAIAVLGPTRMNYPQTLSAVAVVSDQLGNLLSEG